MNVDRTFRRMNKAVRLAQTGEADRILAAAQQIPETRMRHGSALSSPSAVRDYLRLALRDKEHEVFLAVFLDAQHRVITSEELFRGTVSQTSVHPREVVKAALHASLAHVKRFFHWLAGQPGDKSRLQYSDTNSIPA